MTRWAPWLLSLFALCASAQVVITLGLEGSAGGGGAVEITGTPASNCSTANTGTVGVTVAGDATMFVVFASGYETSNSFFTSAEPDLDSSPMTAISILDDVDDGLASAAWYILSPSTGSVNLDWDWGGAGAAAEGIALYWAGIKGNNATTPIKDSGSSQNDNASLSEVTLTAATNDLVLASGSAYNDGGPESLAWNNITEIIALGNCNDEASGLASVAPSGSVTPGLECDGCGDGWDGITAITIQP